MCVNSRMCSCAPLYFPIATEIELSDLNLPEDGHAVEDQSFRAMKSRVVRRFEHDFLATVLHAHDGNITRAAFAVKKNRRAFWQLLRKHDLLAGDQTRLSVAHVTIAALATIASSQGSYPTCRMSCRSVDKIVLGCRAQCYHDIGSEYLPGS